MVGVGASLMAESPRFRRTAECSTGPGPECAVHVEMYSSFGSSDRYVKPIVPLPDDVPLYSHRTGRVCPSISTDEGRAVSGTGPADQLYDDSAVVWSPVIFGMPSAENVIRVSSVPRDSVFPEPADAVLTVARTPAHTITQSHKGYASTPILLLRRSVRSARQQKGTPTISYHGGAFEYPLFALSALRFALFRPGENAPQPRLPVRRNQRDHAVSLPEVYVYIRQDRMPFADD